jgi:hypothetical protein
MLVCIASLDQREAVMRKQETETNASACSRRNLLLGSTTLAAVSALVSVLPFDEVAQAQTQQASSGQKPNVLVIFGDDIGYWNISAYNRGMMGYRTPNIDRIAKEGAIFTDLYAQQSCTAGRAAFLTGQSCFRTGLLKVGLPGAKEGLSDNDPTLAELLKPHGYATGQFGKNHVGDRNEFLPTVHGFDEFFGNLYHLNAEEEPENIDYPSWRSILPPIRTSRRARSPAASHWMRCCRSCRKVAAAVRTDAAHSAGTLLEWGEHSVASVV